VAEILESHAIAGTTARCAVNFEAGSDWPMAIVPLCHGTGVPFDEHNAGYMIHLEI